MKISPLYLRYHLIIKEIVEQKVLKKLNFAIFGTINTIRSICYMYKCVLCLCCKCVIEFRWMS